jgi:hypothetical protein
LFDTGDNGISAREKGYGGRSRVGSSRAGDGCGEAVATLCSYCVLLVVCLRCCPWTGRGSSGPSGVGQRRSVREGGGNKSYRPLSLEEKSFRCSRDKMVGGQQWESVDFGHEGVASRVSSKCFIVVVGSSRSLSKVICCEVQEMSAEFEDFQVGGVVEVRSILQSLGFHGRGSLMVRKVMFMFAMW